MKQADKIYLVFLLFLGVLLTSCDKFDLDFTTPNEFRLDASSHELEAKTKQDVVITNILIDGNWVHIESVPGEIDETRSFDKFDVTYSERLVQEIDGEWFNVKIIDPHTIHISILENNTSERRDFAIRVLHRSTGKTITITQEKGNENTNSLHTTLEEARLHIVKK